MTDQLKTEKLEHQEFCMLFYNFKIICIFNFKKDKNKNKIYLKFQNKKNIYIKILNHFKWVYMFLILKYTFLLYIKI